MNLAQRDYFSMVFSFMEKYITDQIKFSMSRDHGAKSLTHSVSASLQNVLKG